MNPRIKIITDTEVEILSANACSIKLTITDGVLVVQQHGPFGTPSYVNVDADGRAAICECFNCLEATGSFAALRDTSAVPFPGKRMLTLSLTGERVEVVVRCWAKTIAAWKVEDDEGNFYCAMKLSPLTPPQPKVRAYTPSEVAVHLEVRNVRDIRGIGLIREVRKDTVTVSGRAYTYQELADKCTWADDGTPCGIVEE